MLLLRFLLVKLLVPKEKVDVSKEHVSTMEQLLVNVTVQCTTSHCSVCPESHCANHTTSPHITLTPTAVML